MDGIITKANELQAPKICITCGEEDCLKEHQRRKRKLIVVIGNLANIITILLKRWRCVNCGKTFSHYPDFVLPFKRFYQTVITSLATQYLEQEDKGYRKIVCHEGGAIYYSPYKQKEILEEEFQEEIDDRQVSHTSLWRWNGHFGGQNDLLKSSLDLLKQKQPNFIIHREPIVIPHNKYKSPERREILENCLVMLKVAQEFYQEFKKNIFHQVWNFRLEKPG